jgi:O-antigen/teichoic acid export membrane protein
MELRAFVSRLWGTAVAWTWAFNALRLAAGLLLLPLLLRALSTPDLGMHYVFLSVAGLSMMLDFGLGQAAFRALCVAVAGGAELRAVGLAEPAATGSAPNEKLRWRIVVSLRSLYRGVALAAVVLVGVVGTGALEARFGETTSPYVTWLAWALTIASVGWELLAGWWGLVLLAHNQVVLAARLNVVAYLVKLVGAAVLLVAGAGLASVPLAGLAASILQRHLLRRACMRLIGTPPSPEPADVKWLLSNLWPTSWRQGVIAAATYGSNAAVAFLCMALFGLEASARYGLSLQIVVFIQGIASAWTQVKWPMLMQQRAAGDFEAMRRLFGSRLRWQLATFIVLAVGAVVPAPALVSWVSSTKEVLPPAWLGLLALNGMLEMHLSTWGMLITTENRVPMLRAMLVTAAASLAGAALLINGTSLGVHAFVLAPLVAGVAFNYWFWPAHGAKGLGTGVCHVLSGGKG